MKTLRKNSAPKFQVLILHTLLPLFWVREEVSPERLPDHCKHFSKGLKELNEKTPLLPKTSFFFPPLNSCLLAVGWKGWQI